jgi:hypothetical protein
MAALSMNGIADRFSSQDVGSIFLYTHEAHPGENYPIIYLWDRNLITPEICAINWV